MPGFRIKVLLTDFSYINMHFHNRSTTAGGETFAGGEHRPAAACHSMGLGTRQAACVHRSVQVDCQAPLSGSAVLRLIAAAIFEAGGTAGSLLVNSMQATPTRIWDGARPAQRAPVPSGPGEGRAKVQNQRCGCDTAMILFTAEASFESWVGHLCIHTHL